MNKKVIKTLKKYNQEHVIKFMSTLNNEEIKKIENQILKINFKKLKKLYYDSKKNKTLNIKPVKSIEKEKLDENELKILNQYGENIIKKGKYAVITMAGGQGSRLNHNGPKGTFKLNINGVEKSLFEILIDDLEKTNKKYNITLHLYIMTSEENYNETCSFFKENNYFGYNQNKITFFKQTELPLLDLEGKLLIGNNKLIKFASDGNGSIFKSLKKSGVLKKIKQNKTKWVFIGSIDNILLKMSDPTLLGLAIKSNTQIASKTILKSNPEEKVGVFCLNHGHPHVIEYSELPSILAQEKINGELKYGEAHIMCNLFTVKALEKLSKKNLMYHKALKKNSYLNEYGKEIIPTDNNIYKFETFIFDSFNYFKNIAILRGKREEDFAPIKNKDGVDSPRTALKLYMNYWYKK